MLIRKILELGTCVAGLLSTTACTVTAEVPPTYAGRSLVNMAPGNAPLMSGTYDFDLLGETQGHACAEWSETRQQGWYRVTVNGRPANYSVVVAGATLASDDLRVQQAEAAAVFEALSKLKGSDMLFVTRTIVQSQSATQLCATVWGQVARLKKGISVAPDAKDAVGAGSQTSGPSQVTPVQVVPTPVK